MVKSKVKWALSVKIITSITLAITVVCEYYLVHSLIYSTDWINLVGVCLIPLITLYFVWESPTFIEMAETGIVLHKRIERLFISYDKIIDVEYYRPNRSEKRLFGSGGFCGYIGKFKNATIGTYQSFVGDYSNSFLIKTKENKNYVLSCENRDIVINTIKTFIKS
jgi:hypothetical protein